MEYTSSKVAKMAGVSTRTLRYYQEIGLLEPTRVASSGYRIYGQRELDRLQQILFYRELSFPLEEIREILADPAFDRETAFLNHLERLQRRREQLDALIQNVTKSIAVMKGETTMTDTEKFEGFGDRLITENEEKYGAEIRQKYGDQEVDASNQKLKGLTPADYAKIQAIEAEMNAALTTALSEGNPAGEAAQRACDLHRQWLTFFYPDYSRAYHRGLGDLYIADERFKAHYDRLGEGAAQLLRDAIHLYCGEED